MYHCPRETNWIDFCKHNQYCASTIITCNDTIFLTKCLITHQWVISTVTKYNNGFTPHQSAEVHFYQSIQQALDSFNRICIYHNQ